MLKAFRCNNNIFVSHPRCRRNKCRVSMNFTSSNSRFNLLSAAMTCHARSEFFVAKLQYFLNFKYIFIYFYILNITEGKQTINLSFLSNNSYPVIPYRRVEKESDEPLYTVWSLVMVRARS